MTKKIYDLVLTTLAGKAVYFRDYEGQVLLIVNTASACGFTPQYAGLEAVQRQFHDRGFNVLGFPCNQFGAQEPGSAEEIGHFCQTHYDISFPMFAKTEVNGPGTHPLYDYLKSAKRGFLGTKSIKWNFTKFLLDRDGNVVARYGSKVPPERIQTDIARLL